MFELLEKTLSRVAGEFSYADIRYEAMTETEIQFDGRELARIGSNTTDGYVVRVLKDGGFAAVTVTKDSDLEKAMEMAALNASLLGGEGEKETKLTFPEVVVEDLSLELDEDPRQISLDEKLRLTRHYNDLVFCEKSVQTTSMVYSEVFRDKYFVNTKGSKIHNPLITLGISGRIICKKGQLVQNGRVGVGGSNGFKVLRNRDEQFSKKAKIVGQLLEAEPVKGGKYNVVLDSDMAGVFVHEAFGHFSEADLLENNPSLLNKMSMGAKLGTDIVDIVDDPTKFGQVGYYKYDDEGVLARPVTLMEGGVLKGRLHSMKTAACFGDELTGHTVAEDFKYEPIVRMGCIYIRPKDKSFEDLLKIAGNGLYVLGCKGGQTSGENFTFGAQYAYLIQDGKLGPMVRDINIMGNLYTTLKSIKAISKDFHLSEIGGCGKGQMNIKSCHGGPHVLIEDLVVGGV